MQTTKAPQLQPNINEEQGIAYEKELNELKQKKSRCLCQDLRRKGSHLHQPNRKVSFHIKSRKQVCYGHVLYQWKLHHDGSNEVEA